MRWFLILLVLTLPVSSLPSLAQEQPPNLNTVKKIFIEKMENDLDQYLRAEFVKQFKGKVSVVLQQEDADALLVGVSEESKGTGAKITGPTWVSTTSRPAR